MAEAKEKQRGKHGGYREGSGRKRTQDRDLVTECKTVTMRKGLWDSLPVNDGESQTRCVARLIETYLKTPVVQPEPESTSKPRRKKKQEAVPFTHEEQDRVVNLLITAWNNILMYAPAKADEDSALLARALKYVAPNLEPSIDGLVAMKMDRRKRDPLRQREINKIAAQQQGSE